MQRILPRSSLCLSGLPWVRGCVWLCCLKSRECGLLVTARFLFSPASALEQLVLASASCPWWGSQQGTPALGCKREGASDTSTLCRIPITPVWPGEVKGAPGVTYSTWWHCPGSTSHSPGGLRGTGLVRGEERSQIHSPGQNLLGNI